MCCVLTLCFSHYVYLQLLNHVLPTPSVLLSFHSRNDDERRRRLCWATIRSLRSRIASPPTGTTFTHWIADHNVLWSSPLTPGALEQSIRYYALIAGGSAALGWVYIGVLLVAFVAAAGKLCSDWGKGGEILFDGASVCEYYGSGRGVRTLGMGMLACGDLNSFVPLSGAGIDDGYLCVHGA